MKKKKQLKKKLAHASKAVVGSFIATMWSIGTSVLAGYALVP